ncbi:hypothetical protein J6590_033223 [Homalodisca vitripennis]|nr:hypothetical protein J6590_033223 [Homalodisca vitripennis]
MNYSSAIALLNTPLYSQFCKVDNTRRLAELDVDAPLLGSSGTLAAAPLLHDTYADAEGMSILILLAGVFFRRTPCFSVAE